MSAYTVNSYANLLPDPRGKPTPEQDLPRAVWTATKRRNFPGPTTDNRYVQADQHIGTQYIAIERIADGLAGAAIQILQRQDGGASALTSRDARRGKDWTPIDSSHPAVRLFEHVNPVDTLIGFLRKYVICKMLFGGVYLYSVHGRSGKPVEIWVVPPQYVMPGIGITPNYPFGSYRLLVPQPMSYGYTQAGMAIVDSRHMIFDRKFNPRFEWDAYSPLKAGALQIDLLRAINESRKEAMDKGLSLDAVVTVEGASDLELERLRKQFDEKYTGTSGARTMFAGGEGIKAAALGIAPKEMAFEQGYEQLTNFVLSLFAVPHGVAGLTDAGSYAAYYAALQQFRGLKLQPEADEIAAVWTKHLIRPSYGDDYKLTIELPPLVDQDDLKQRYSMLLQGGGVTVNEERAAHNLDPLDGGDVPMAVYLQTEQQKAQPQPQPQPGAMPGGLPGLGGQETNAGDNSELIPGQPQPGDAAADESGNNSADGQEDNPLTTGVLQALGVQGGAVQKSFDESKHPRDHGKFSSKPGAAGDAPAFTREQAEAVARNVRAALEAECGGDTKDWCNTTAEAVKAAYPDAEIYHGGYEGQEDDQAHTIFKINGWYMDVTADQFGGPDVFVAKELPDDLYPDFRRTSASPPAGPGKRMADAIRPTAAVKKAWTRFTTQTGGVGARNEQGREIYGQEAEAALAAQQSGGQPANSQGNSQNSPSSSPNSQGNSPKPGTHRVSYTVNGKQQVADIPAASEAEAHEIVTKLGGVVSKPKGGTGAGAGATGGQPAPAGPPAAQPDTPAGQPSLPPTALPIAKRAEQQVIPVAQKLARDPKARQAAESVGQWGPAAAEKNAALIAATHNLDRVAAQDLFLHVLSLLVGRLPGVGQAASVGLGLLRHHRMTQASAKVREAAKQGGEPVEAPTGPRPEVAAAMQQARAKQGVLSNATAIGPKRPTVPGSAGSLPPRLKSLAAAYVRRVNKSLKQGG